MKKIKTLEDFLPEEMKSIAADDKVGLLKKEILIAEELKKAQSEKGKRIIHFRDGNREIDIFLKPSGAVVVYDEERMVVDTYVSASGRYETVRTYSRGPETQIWRETRAGYWDKTTKTVERSFIPTEDELIELAKKSGEDGLKALLEVWD